jgi:hypothetical protein
LLTLVARAENGWGYQFRLARDSDPDILIAHSEDLFHPIVKTLLKRLFHWLFPAIAPLDFPSLEDLKSELRLRRKAITNGRRDLPASDSTEPDEVEIQIRQRIASERQKAERKHEQQQQIQQEKLETFQPSAVIADIKIQVGNAVADFKAIANRAVVDLHKVYEKTGLEQKALHDFRVKHRLTAPADYPESQLLHWGFIALILVIEITISAGFFSEGLRASYSAAIPMAVGISVCNIGITIVASYFLMRQLFHRNWLRKIVWGGLYLAIIACVVLINLFFAHVRDAMSAPGFRINNPEGFVPVNDIIASMMEGSLSLQSLKSYLFLAVTNFFCLLAIIDVFKMDDPYPGYGKRERRADRAYEEWIEAKDEVHARLTASREKNTQAIEELNTTLGQKMMLRRKNLGLMRSLEEKHRNMLEILGSYERELIAFYRKLNKESRSTQPPRYFDEEP